MIILLTPEQAQGIPAEGEPVLVGEPLANRLFRLVPEDDYQRMKLIPYDGALWTAEESAILAGAAFGKLDDTDYSEYLREGP